MPAVFTTRAPSRHCACITRSASTSCSCCEGPHAAHRPRVSPDTDSSSASMVIGREFSGVRYSVCAVHADAMTCLPSESISSASRFHPSARAGNTAQSADAMARASSRCVANGFVTSVIRDAIRDLMNGSSIFLYDVSSTNGLEQINTRRTASLGENADSNARNSSSCPLRRSSLPTFMNTVWSSGRLDALTSS